MAEGLQILGALAEARIFHPYRHSRAGAGGTGGGSRRHPADPGVSLPPDRSAARSRAHGQDRQRQEGPVCGAARYPPRRRQGGFHRKPQGGADRARIVFRLQQPGGRYARAADHGGGGMAGGFRRHAQRAAAERRGRSIGRAAAIHRAAGVGRGGDGDCGRFRGSARRAGKSAFGRAQRLAAQSVTQIPAEASADRRGAASRRIRLERRGIPRRHKLRYSHVASPKYPQTPAAGPASP